MSDIENLLLLLAILAILAPITKWLHIAQPIGFVLGGLILSLIPAFPSVSLDPEIIFLLFLPPLLYIQSFFTSWRNFRRELRPIIFLAVGLVLFTTVGIGYLAHAVIPSLPLAAGFVLGAIVSSPDAVAVAGVSQQLRLPHRLVTILEGESLVNDATSLVALSFALSALASGQFSFAAASFRFFGVASGGIAVGLITGWLMLRLRERVRDESLSLLLSLLSPYAAYIPADRLGFSGVLAAVSAGLFLGWRLPRHLTYSMRLQGAALWRMIEFILNGLIFLLIGLQLKVVVAQVKERYHVWQLALFAVVICLGVILLRPLWIFLMVPLQRFLIPGLRRRDPVPPLSFQAVLSWSGIRGVVSLAAALGLNQSLEGGQPFPSRELIIYLTFCVIIATLVLQGLTFPWLVRRLGVRETANHHRAERTARHKLASVALAALEAHPATADGEPEGRESLRTIFQRRLREAEEELLESHESNRQRESAIAASRLRLATLAAEREELFRQRLADESPDSVLLKLQQEIDFEEARLRLGLGT